MLRRMVLAVTGVAVAGVLFAGCGNAAPKPTATPTAMRLDRDALIAFASDRKGSSDIWMLDASLIARQVTNDAGAEFHPALSPNGERIAFVSDRDHPREI